MGNGNYIIQNRLSIRMQRSFLLFTNGLKSKETVRQYIFYVEKFMKFYTIKDYDSLSKIPPKKLQIMVEDYVMDLKKRVSPNTVPTPMYAIQAFFESNDVELKWKKIKRLYPAKVKLSGERGWKTEEIQKMLQFTTNLRTKSLIHFLASTGVRIGGIPDLQLRHIKEMPNDCKSVLIYEDSTEEYTTFLTPEASKVLDDYFSKRKSDGEKLEPTSPVFRTSYQLGIQTHKPTTKKSTENSVGRSARNAQLRNNKKNGRYEVQLEHGFRKRFNTILKLNRKINPNLVEKLMGHKRGLDNVYLKPTIEELFEEFTLGIGDLSIDNTERILAKKEKEQQESFKEQMDEMKQELEELKYGPTGRRNKYNQNRLDAPDTLEMQLYTIGIPILLELVLSEEKKRDMMKEFENAELENRKPNLHKIFGSREMDEDHIQFLKKYLKEHPNQKDSSKSTNYVKPRLRFENLETMLSNHN